MKLSITVVAMNTGTGERLVCDCALSLRLRFAMRILEPCNHQPIRVPIAVPGTMTMGIQLPGTGERKLDIHVSECGCSAFLIADADGLLHL